MFQLTLDIPQTRDLFPLRDSFFEGQMVKIPYNYAKLLTQEYGKASLTKTEYSGYDTFTYPITDVC